MKKKLYLMLFLFSATFVLKGCTSDNDFQKGKQQLEQQGYIEVENTGYNFFCCDEKDSFSTGFRCKNKNGVIIKGCFVLI